MDKIWSWLVQAFLAVVAYAKGRYDQEQRGKEAAKEKVDDSNKNRADVETRIRDASADERERLRSKHFRD